MAGINTTISIMDKASSALQRISTASDRLTDSLKKADNASKASFAGERVDALERGLADAAEAANEAAFGLDSIGGELDRASSSSDALGRSLYEASEVAGKVSKEGDEIPRKFSRATDEADKLHSTLSKVLTVAAAIKGIDLVKDWAGGSIDLANQQQIAEQQLKSVLKNNYSMKVDVETGSSEYTLSVDANTELAERALNRIKEKASELQSISIYGDEAYIAGAGEFARVLKDQDAIMVMMETLSDYASGMSGGAQLDTSGMAGYAEELSKALNGTYTMLERNNFKLTEEQKKIIENGSDMEKALTLSEVVGASWNGLAEDMAKLPNGQVTQFKNLWSDFREDMGEKLQPAVVRLYETIEDHLPQIEGIINAGIGLVADIVDGISNVIDAASECYDFISSNWSEIGPIINVIAIALGIATAAMIAHAVATKSAAAAHALLSSTAVRGALALIAAVGLATIAVSTLDNVTMDGANNTYSALGVVTGAFAAVAGIIWNIIVWLATIVVDVVAGIWNIFAALANFIANVFRDPIGACIKLFVDMADVVLAVLEGIATGLDWVFGSNMAGTINGWRKDMEDFYKDVIQKQDVVVEKIDAEEYKKNILAMGADVEKLAVAGYDWGAGIANGEKGIVNIEDYYSTDGIENPYENYNPENFEEKINGIGSDTAQIASNTSQNDVTEILRLLRDISEREAINRFTTAEVKVDIGGITNQVESNVDIDDLNDYITGKLEEEVAITARQLNYGL